MKEPQFEYIFGKTLSSKDKLGGKFNILKISITPS